jgi:hypothetical protein
MAPKRSRAALDPGTNGGVGGITTDRVILLQGGLQRKQIAWLKWIVKKKMTHRERKYAGYGERVTPSGVFVCSLFSYLAKKGCGIESNKIDGSQNLVRGHV